MLAVKFRALVIPEQRQVPSARVRAPAPAPVAAAAANTGLTLPSRPRPPHGDAANVTTSQPPARQNAAELMMNTKFINFRFGADVLVKPCSLDLPF